MISWYCRVGTLSMVHEAAEGRALRGRALPYFWKKSWSARDISHEVDKRPALLGSFTLIALLYWMVEADS